VNTTRRLIDRHSRADSIGLPMARAGMGLIGKYIYYTCIYSWAPQRHGPPAVALPTPPLRRACTEHCATRGLVPNCEFEVRQTDLNSQAKDA
jgi:hypothetical protein